MDLLDNIPKAEQDSPRRELVTWGANRNFVLGLQGDSERTFAERVPLERAVPTYRKADAVEQVEEAYSTISVEKIAMEKLHSGLLTDEPRGNFRLCGFGSTTGRLGHNSSHPQFAFEPLKGFESQRVVDFALGQDHTILCTQEGNVYTFGLNVSILSTISIPEIFLRLELHHRRSPFSAIPLNLQREVRLVRRMTFKLRPNVCSELSRRNMSEVWRPQDTIV